MATSPTTPPVVNNWPVSPSRTRPLDFPLEADAFLSHFPTGQADQQSLADWQNDTAQQVYNNALEAEKSATQSSDSASVSTSSANFKGNWSDLTGQLLMPASVFHNGAYWQLLYSLADVTLSEPSTDSAYWAFISGSDFIYTTTSTTIPAGAKIQVSAFAAPVDIDLPAGITVGKTVTLRNNINSTQQVRLTNSTYSIVGNGGSLVAGDNLIFAAGVTKTLVCRATNILEII